MVATTDSRTQEHKPQVHLNGRGPRRWRWAVAAIAAMAVGAAAVLLALDQVDQRAPALVAADDMPAGHVVEADDLQIVQLGGTEVLPTLSEAEVAVGATLTVPVTSGTVLAEEMLGQAGEHLESGQALVAVPLPEAGLPSSLQPASAVTVVMTGEVEDTVAGQVQSVSTAGDEPGAQASVELVVAAADAARVARAAAEEEITLVQTGPGGD